MSPLDSMVGLEWIPSFTYDDCGVPQNLTLTIPQGAWRYAGRYKGGWDEAESGVQESWGTREDKILRLLLRFTEEEWVEGVWPMLAILHSQAQEFTIQFDKDDGGTAHTVYLVAPVPNDEVEPRANPFSGILELELSVRSSDGSDLSYPYFPSLA